MKCYMYDQCNHKDCEAEFCLRKYKLDSLFTKANIFPMYRKKQIMRIDANGADLEAFKQLAAIEQNICAFVEEGQNLFIYSTNSGNGKTSWAYRLVQAYFNNIWAKTDLTCRAIFIDVPQFLIDLKNNLFAKEKDPAFEERLNNIKIADIVVWDDIAAKTGTDYEINQLLSYINNRIMQGKSNIYTANVLPADLYDVLGSRLASRIANMSVNIKLIGADKRNQFVNNEFGGN